MAPYLCPAGRWTCGYGHASREVEDWAKAGRQLTEHQAEVILASDLEKFSEAVKSLTKTVALNENEFSALVSFAFNIGVTRFATSTLLRKLKKGDEVGAAEEFSKWVHAGNAVLPGLSNRRAAERKLFETPCASH